MARTCVVIMAIVWTLFIGRISTAPLISRRDGPATPTAISEQEMLLLRASATFAADAYCTDLQEGSSVGSDGTVLWKMGDGDHLQMVYVAYSPTLGIVVAHQGTNISSIASLGNDLRVNKVPRDERLTALPSDAQVAEGFQDAWLDTADEVMSQVALARALYPAAQITFTGHSLGAAISLFDALMVGQSFNVTVGTFLFGLPRVGDKSFANAVDTLLRHQRHVTNANDPIPHLPFRAWGYQQPSGEVWIPSDANDNQAVGCFGQENPSCTDSVEMYDFDLKDHSGPYFGTAMACSRKR